MEPRLEVTNHAYKGFTHYACPFYPCHDVKLLRIPTQFNCLFCTCPLYWLACPGPYTVFSDSRGLKRKDCTDCKLPHDGYDRSWRLMNLSRFQTRPEPWDGT